MNFSATARQPTPTRPKCRNIAIVLDVSMLPRSSVRVTAADPVHGRRRQVAERLPDAARLQIEAIQDRVRHGTTQAISDLVERTVGAEIAEGGIEDRRDLLR